MRQNQPIYKVGYKSASTDYNMMEKAKSYFGTLEQRRAYASRYIISPSCLPTVRTAGRAPDGVQETVCFPEKKTDC